MVRSEHVRTFFDSTQSQQSKYEVCAQEFYAAMRIKTYLNNALYLSSLLSDLSMFKDNHQIINDRLYRCTVFIISAPCSEHLQTTLSLQKRQLVEYKLCIFILYYPSLS